MADQGRALAAKREKVRRILEGRREREASVGSVTHDVAQSAARGFNTGLAKGVGGMVDLFNLPFGFDKPVGGTEWLSEKFSRANLTGGEKYPFIAKAAEVPGMAVPFFLAGGAVARTAATGGKYFAPILESYRRAPGLNALTELYTASRAGVGGALARELFPESDNAEVAGQIVGGITSPVAAGAVLAKKVAGPAKRTISRLLPGGAERSSAELLQKLVPDPQGAAKTLKASKEGRLTPAQELGDPGLLRLQKAFEGADPNIAQKVADKAGVVRTGQKAEIEGLASGERGTAAEFLQQRLQGVAERADSLSAKAVLKAQTALEKLPKGTNKEIESIAARDSINKSHKLAKVEEGRLWDEVDGTHLTKTDELFKLYGKIQARLTKAQKSDIPEVISKHLAKKAAKDIRFGKTEPLSEIKSFRTKVRIARQREASETVPDRTVLGILGDMEEKALEVMSKSGARGALDEARMFSRQLHVRFTEGIIGKIRGVARRGGQKVEDVETLLHVVREGPRGSVRYDQLLKATEKDPDAIAAVENYVGRLFVKQATDNAGKVTPGAANRFMQNNRELLDKLPGLNKRLGNAKTAQELADSTSKRMSGRVKTIWDKRRSRAALYLSGKPGTRIRTILNSQDPEGNMNQLVRQASKDPTGGATQGLRGELLDELWKEGMNKGVDMSTFFNKNKGSFNQLFSPDEQLGINRLIGESIKLERSVAGGKNLQQIMDETPDIAIDLLSRILGANVGGIFGKSSGASFVTAHAGSRIARMITNKIPIGRTRDVLAEAVLDKTKMAQLLERVETPKQAADLSRRMNSWLLGVVQGSTVKEKKQGRAEKTVAPPMMQIPLGNRLTQ